MSCSSLLKHLLDSVVSISFARHRLAVIAREDHVALYAGYFTHRKGSSRRGNLHCSLMHLHLHATRHKDGVYPNSFWAPYLDLLRCSREHPYPPYLCADSPLSFLPSPNPTTCPG